MHIELPQLWHCCNDCVCQRVNDLVNPYESQTEGNICIAESSSAQVACVTVKNERLQQ